METVYLFFAEGSEEVEALAVVDILRRAGVETRIVSVTGDKMVTGAHDRISICLKIREWARIASERRTTV